MTVEAETLSSTMLNKVKKIDLELLLLKLFEVNAETISDALGDIVKRVLMNYTAYLLFDITMYFWMEKSTFIRNDKVISLCCYGFTITTDDLGR